MIKTLVAEIRSCEGYREKLGRVDAFMVDCADEEIQEGTYKATTLDNKYLRELWDKLYL